MVLTNKQRNEQCIEFFSLPDTNHKTDKVF